MRAVWARGLKRGRVWRLELVVLLELELLGAGAVAGAVVSGAGLGHMVEICRRSAETP
jgi:hypothetical protein